MEMDNLVNQWQQVKEKRRQLEAQGEKLKEAEKWFESQIQMWLGAQGLTGAKVAGGTVSQKTNWSARLCDSEAFARLQYNKMKEIDEWNRSEGVVSGSRVPTSMIDGLLMQKRPLKEGVETVAREMCEKGGIEATPEAIAEMAKTFGIDYVPVTTLTFSKK